MNNYFSLPLYGLITNNLELNIFSSMASELSKPLNFLQRYGLKEWINTFILLDGISLTIYKIPLHPYRRHMDYLALILVSTRN